MAVNNLHLRANRKKNKFDLSSDTLYTANFGEPLVSYITDVLPADDLKGSSQTFVRTAPLARPTYAKLALKTATFFVPYHTLGADIDAFVSGDRQYNGNIAQQRMFSSAAFHGFCLDTMNRGTELACCTLAEGTSADFFLDSYIDDEEQSITSIGYNYTPLGKKLLKLLSTLGYNPDNHFRDRPFQSYYSGIGLSALRILAYLRVWCDYYQRQQLYNISMLSNFLQSVRNAPFTTNVVDYRLLNHSFKSVIVYDDDYDLVPSDYRNKPLLYYGLFAALLDTIKQGVSFESDYFTSAWRNELNVFGLNTQVNSLRKTDLNNGFTWNEQLNADGDAPNVHIDDNTGRSLLPDSDFVVKSSISDTLLKSLAKLTRWYRKNSYVGSNSLNRLLARFGIKSSDYGVDSSMLLSTDTQIITIGDVTSTSDTSTAKLGSYAGKAVAKQNTGWSFSSKDYGVILSISYFTYKPQYATGINRSFLHVRPFDFYTPDFDDLSGNVIATQELISRDTMSMRVFGFTERYNEYRFNRDVVCGDFVNNDADRAWTIARFVFTGDNPALQAQATEITQVTNEPLRIFANYTGGDYDHFYVITNNNVSALRQIASLTEAADLEEGNLNVTKNGNQL